MRIELEKLLRPGMSGIKPYSPGKPVEEVQRQYSLKTACKMASNENPLGPSPLAVEAAAKSLGKINFYPDGGCYYLKEKLSVFLGVSPESIIVGNGSDEIIRIIAETFLNPGEEAVISDPSFVVYETAVRVMDAKPVIVPLDNFCYDIDAILRAVNKNTKLVFFANPNNPTGTILTGKDAQRYMQNIPEGVITVFDEAYFEYVQAEDYFDSLKYTPAGHPVVTLRTFSKIYGLAGLRAGYAVADSRMVSEMNRIRQPFNVNSLAQAAAAAALDDFEHLEKSRKLNSEGKMLFYSELEKMNVEYVPTQANFILIKTGSGAAVSESFLKKGIIVRDMDCYGLFDYIRVTVGREKENRGFLSLLKQIVEG